jgi:hypothetical protein
MEACAMEIGLARSTLTVFSILATRWAPDQLRTLFERRGLRGRSLSLTQLVLIARRPRPEGAQWIERVLGEDCDVRELKERMRKGHGP